MLCVVKSIESEKGIIAWFLNSVASLLFLRLPDMKRGELKLLCLFNDNKESPLHKRDESMYCGGFRRLLYILDMIDAFVCCISLYDY